MEHPVQSNALVTQLNILRYGNSHCTHFLILAFPFEKVKVFGANMSTENQLAAHHKIILIDMSAQAISRFANFQVSESDTMEKILYNVRDGSNLLTSSIFIHKSLSRQFLL